MEDISKTFGFFFSYAEYYYCTPYRWDKETKRLEINTRISSRHGWIFSIGISCIFTCIHLIIEIVGIANKEKVTPMTQFRQLQLLGTCLCLFSQINTVWNLHEFKEIVNQWNHRLRILEQENLLPTLPGIALKFKLVMIAVIFGAHLVPLGCIITAYSEFNPGIWVKIGAVQQVEPGRRDTWPLWQFLVITLIEFLIQAQQFCSLLLYAAALAGGTLSFTEILREMRKATQSPEDSKLVDPDYFVTFIRSTFMLTQRFKNWTATFAACGYGTIVLIIVYINYAVLAVRAYVLVKIIAATVNVALIIFFAVVLDLASYIYSYSADSILAMEDLCKDQGFSKYHRLRIRACIPSKICIGNLFYIDETIVPVTADLILGKTIDAVLTFG